MRFDPIVIEPYDPNVERRTHHLHVVVASSSGWPEWLAFRDYLRSHPDDVVAYAELEARLATEHGHDPNERDAYRRGKAGFIRTVTDRARAERLPRFD